MNKRIFKEIIVITLVTILCFSNILLLGNYKAYAIDTNTDNLTNNENVEFDAYYIDQSNKPTHSINQDINSKDLQIALYMKVTKGYLKNIKINMFGKDENTKTNFNISNNIKEISQIENIDLETNIVKLKQLDKDTKILITLPIYANKDDIYDISNLNKENGIKITATYVNNAGKEEEISKTVKTNIKWIAQIKAIIEQEVIKNINITSNKKVMLQTLVRTGLENNDLPIQETNINVKVPTIQGIKPEKVLVMANQTKATNGKEGIAFTKENWNYNETTGQLNINTRNEAIQNKIVWDKTAKDEYIITYIFPENITQSTPQQLNSQQIITEETSQETTSELEVKQTTTVKITTYGTTVQSQSETTQGLQATTQAIPQEATANQEIKIDMATLKGEVISNNISNSIKQLSKGYFYSKLNKNIEYTTKNIVQIPTIELIDKIVITNNGDTFLAGDKVAYLTNYALYSQTTINKTILDTLLGEQGYINIYNTNKELITTINKDTKIENGNYVHNYENPTNAIIIETSKPITEGNLIIENKKTINCNTNYSNEQIAIFDNLKISSQTKAIKTENIINTQQPEEITTNEQEISNVYAQNIVKLIEPQTKIEAQINKNSLSTIIKNEGIQIKTILKTNDETCMLYENPVIEIELPNYVEDIEINNITLGYTNTLKYDETKTEILTNNIGNKIIRIPLEGKDEDYNFNNISKGANIIVDANLILAKLTPTTTSQININVYNNNGTSQNANTKIDVTAIAPVGMVTTTQVSTYSARNINAIALNGQEQILKLDVNTVERNITVQMDIINNYNNICRNISILGKIPYQVSKLKSPIALKQIDANKVTVYYSENENATKELNVQANGWTTNPQDLSQVKSYLIVINEYEMQTGKNLEANFDLLIPANLSYNLESNLTYTVYYDNVTKEQTIKDSTVAAKTILTTGQGPELQVGISASVKNGAEVQEGTNIKYTVSVKNVGKSVVENVTLKGNVPERTIYFEYAEVPEAGVLDQKYDANKTEYAKKIDIIQPGETKTIEYNVQVQELRHISDDTNLKEDDEIPLEEVELNTIGQAIVEGYEKTFTSNSIKNKVIQGYINVAIETAPLRSNYARDEGDELEYSINVVNVNNKEKRNVVATCKLPEDIAFNYVSSKNATYNENTHTVTWNIGTLDGLATKSLIIGVLVMELEENVYEKEASTKVLLKTSEKEIESNTVTFEVRKPNLSVKLSTETQKEVNVGENIIYNILVESTSGAGILGLEIKDTLPEGLIYKDAQYTYNGKKYQASAGGEREATIYIPTLVGHEKVEVQLTAVADTLSKDEQSREITNVVKVSSKEITEITSNEVKHTILSKKTTTDPSTDGEVVEGTYKISGVAWIDANKNGKREDEEPKLENVEVMLINAENGQIVKDIKTGNDKIQSTTQEGLYNFTNIPEGKYIVVYSYDTGKYTLTEYKKEGVIASRNSDALSTNVNINGATRLVAATDTIQITNENAYNMDIGLIEKSKFNLSLDKSISKITIKNSKETKTYNYGNSKLAKIDLNAKTINDTNIIIEYKIKVSNIGDVEGYAKRIVDYMPQDMSFSSELNKDWYTSDNGNIYNSSLANTVIKPGETKELTLVLTKKMSNDNMGIINNKAEIYEAYNNLGLEDEDSTPANKVENENDMSSADAIISIKTGEIPTYIGITVGIIVILAVGIYFIKKKVL